jgi:tripartite-type tricarboxylate transporter receptor subunit TctC
LKKLFFTLLLLGSAVVNASEVIKIYSPYSPSHSATPALYKIIDAANSSQTAYTFILEFKPGGNQTIAVTSLTTENSLAIIAPAYVDNIATGKLKEENYVPVYALGNACWAVVTNKDFKNQTEFTLGGVGYGNASHLTGLMLAEKYKFKTRYIVFKSNNDALINMAGNNGVEFVIDRYESYAALKTKNSNLKMVAASCQTRLPQEPKVKTLKELGMDAPYVFNIIVASKSMNETRRKAIGIILNNATKFVGPEEIYKLSAVRPPVFDNVTVEEFYATSMNTVRIKQEQFKQQINNARQ